MGIPYNPNEKHSKIGTQYAIGKFLKYRYQK
jgi:hypothetical protein